MKMPSVEEVKERLYAPTSNCLIFVSDCEQLEIVFIAGQEHGFEFTASYGGRNYHGTAHNSALPSTSDNRSEVISAVYDDDPEYVGHARRFAGALMYAAGLEVLKSENALTEEGEEE